METIDLKKIKESLESHSRWLDGEKGAEKADLGGMDLSGLDLSEINL